MCVSHGVLVWLVCVCAEQYCYCIYMSAAVNDYFQYPFYCASVLCFCFGICQGPFEEVV
jgi:hypothetical protein